jgi:hypothetical protein
MSQNISNRYTDNGLPVRRLSIQLGTGMWSDVKYLVLPAIITRRIWVIFCLISNFRRVLNVVFFLFGWIPSVWIFYADVSEHSILFRLRRWCKQEEREDGTECYETSSHKIQKTEIHPKERIQVTFCLYESHLLILEKHIKKLITTLYLWPVLRFLVSI